MPLRWSNTLLTLLLCLFYFITSHHHLPYYQLISKSLHRKEDTQIYNT